MKVMNNGHLTIIDSWGTQIVCISYGDWIDCRDTSPNVFLFGALCNGLKIHSCMRSIMATSLSSQQLVVCSDENITSGPILYFNADSPVTIMLQKSEQATIRNFKFD